MKFRTCTWKKLQKCPWKINSLREIFSKFTYVKIWPNTHKKNQNSFREKKRTEISRILQLRDTFAFLNLQIYNFYLESNAYVAALGSIDPAERPEIKIFDLQKRRMYL